MWHNVTTRTKNLRENPRNARSETVRAKEFYMPLFGFSSDFIINGTTTVDNMFINEYLPAAKGEYVKVYIYGLFLASHGKGNSIEELTRALSMSYEEAFEAFQYLELSGLIEIVSQNPPEIKFVGVKNRDFQSKKRYKPEKYADFNKALQGLFHSRVILPNEFLEYYDFIEKNRVAPEAMIMIAAYCINVKGDGVGFQYVLAVAKDWAAGGVTTPEKAEEKIRELELLTGDVKQVFAALGKKSAPEFSDRETLSKWKARGFSMAAVLFAAKRCKNKGGMAKLDALLENYHKMNLHAPQEIAEYAERRDRLYALAAEINKKIGLYYESLDNIVETYTVNWCEMGFDDDALLTLANYCLLKGLRRLSDMDALVVKFYKMGRLTTDGINQYIDGLIKDDGFIKKLYDLFGLNKFVTQKDRETASVWLDSWGFSEELILFAAEFAKDKTHPFAYLNQILSDYKQNGIFTPEKAKEYSKTLKTPEPKKTDRGFTQREYSKEELDALFVDLNTTDKLEL
jgi:DnaD/phage-associated family protein